MMSATADSVVPVDFRGNQVSLEDIQNMIALDVAELNALYRLKALEEATAAGQGMYISDRRLINQIAMWEMAHDQHWAWYRARTNEST